MTTKRRLSSGIKVSGFSDVYVSYVTIRLRVYHIISHYYIFSRYKLLDAEAGSRFTKAYTACSTEVLITINIQTPLYTEICERNLLPDHASSHLIPPT